MCIVCGPTDQGEKGGRLCSVRANADMHLESFQQPVALCRSDLGAVSCRLGATSLIVPVLETISLTTFFGQTGHLQEYRRCRQ
jgi:hypothetical protein